ncbi:hypothetical protein GCM10007160_43760 [Litchfieldella qijiaojingensis]|uniref:Uncharacterized protein n=1 Tax=Litchfieldella qijiaojingensis TaxID=980347 RepID=A0ABQ2ZGU5_9GAMM|nr:hypothetical protein GCM10007160_43760 [Halomonas qijiaojingensis]
MATYHPLRRKLATINKVPSPLRQRDSNEKVSEIVGAVHIFDNEIANGEAVNIPIAGSAAISPINVIPYPKPSITKVIYGMEYPKDSPTRDALTIIDTGERCLTLFDNRNIYANSLNKWPNKLLVNIPLR